MGSGDITVILKQAQSGSDEAKEALFTMLHTELRRNAQNLMRGERVNHTLQATALVNEACLRLIKTGVVDSADNRRQLFHAAIRAMRQILVDHARGRETKKRGGDRRSIDADLDEFEAKYKVSFPDLDLALGRLEEESPREFEVLNLRFFAGMTVDETARLLDCSRSTVEANWRFARAKLMTWLEDS